MDLKSELDKFSGGDEFYRHFLGGSFTEGVKFLCEEAKCHWLLDAVFSYIPDMKRSGDWFFPVVLERVKDNSFRLTIGEKDTPCFITQDIEYSDFPLSHFKLFVADNGGDLGLTALLPSEY